MAELIHEHPARLKGEDGTTYIVRIYAQESITCRSWKDSVNNIWSVFGSGGSSSATIRIAVNEQNPLIGHGCSSSIQ